MGLPFPPTNDQDVCDHDTSCGCYAEEHAAGMAEANAKRQCDALADIARLRRILDHVHQAADSPRQPRESP